MRKKNSLLVLTLLLSGFSLPAQNNLDLLIAQIEKNNSTLAAFRQESDAERIGNRTGLSLQNPEVGFNYLWGSPAAIGHRTDVSVTQSFDFPSAYHHRRQIASIKDEQVELSYQQQRLSVLLQARQVAIQLIHSNALKVELENRLQHTRQIAEAWQAKLDRGEANLLDLNKARINLLNLSKELEHTSIERSALLSELKSLNGGIEVTLPDSIYPKQAVTADFEHWILQAEQYSPQLGWLKREIELRKREEKLSLAMALPKLEAGYMSEKVSGEQFQGVTLGISLPLWENRNQLKYAKAKSEATRSAEADAKLQFYNRLQALHQRVIQLQSSVNDFRKQLHQYSNTELLQKALDKGAISLTDYFIEQSVYYESFTHLLEMEMKLNLAIAELNQYQ